jgi:hypothetical protein
VWICVCVSVCAVSVRRECLCAGGGCEVCLSVERCEGCVHMRVHVWVFVCGTESHLWVFLSKTASYGTRLSLAGDMQ